MEDALSALATWERCHGAESALVGDAALAVGNIALKVKDLEMARRYLVKAEAIYAECHAAAAAPGGGGNKTAQQVGYQVKCLHAAGLIHKREAIIDDAGRREKTSVHYLSR